MQRNFARSNSNKIKPKKHKQQDPIQTVTTPTTRSDACGRRTKKIPQHQQQQVVSTVVARAERKRKRETHAIVARARRGVDSKTKQVITNPSIETNTNNIIVRQSPESTNKQHTRSNKHNHQANIVQSISEYRTQRERERDTDTDVGSWYVVITTNLTLNKEIANL
jgi:hypothetical protein